MLNQSVLPKRRLQFRAFSASPTEEASIGATFELYSWEAKRRGQALGDPLVDIFWLNVHAALSDWQSAMQMTPCPKFRLCIRQVRQMPFLPPSPSRTIFLWLIRTHS